MSVELNAYLFLPGNAEQAIAFYQQVFGGEVSITRVGDVDPTAAPEQKNLVINAQLIRDVFGPGLAVGRHDGRPVVFPMP